MSDPKPHADVQKPVAIDPADEARFRAAVKMFQNVGGASFEIRYSEPDHPGDMSPLVWIAIVNMHPAFQAPPQVAAGLSPYLAAYRLLQHLVNGGTCAHCGLTTAIDDAHDRPHPREMCWQIFDPELEVFRRSCEGRPS
jgi:hypothetical protein